MSFSYLLKKKSARTSYVVVTKSNTYSTVKMNGIILWYFSSVEHIDVLKIWCLIICFEIKCWPWLNPKWFLKITNFNYKLNKQAGIIASWKVPPSVLKIYLICKSEAPHVHECFIDHLDESWKTLNSVTLFIVGELQILSYPLLITIWKI